MSVAWKTEERLLRELADVRAELARVRQVASLDLQNAHADLVAKNRKVGALEAELAKVRDDEDGTAESRDVKELLILWRRWVRGDNKRVNISHPSRKKAMLAILKLYGRARTENAIRGMPYDDWAMGRTPRSEKAYNDVKHLASDAERFEHFERLWHLHNPERNRQLELTVDEKAQRAIERSGVYRFYANPGAWPPITKVLHALRQAGRHVIAHDGKPDSWSAQCPAHVDNQPSLSVHRTASGNVLLHCFGPCDTEDVLDALGLWWRDLFTNSERDYQRGDAVYAEAHRPNAQVRRVTRELYEQLARWGNDESEGGDAPQ